MSILFRPIYRGYYEVSKRGIVRRLKSGRGTRVGYRLSPWPKHVANPYVDICLSGDVIRAVKVSELIKKAWG